MRTVERTVPAPEHLSLDVIGVPEGADVELRLRLEAVMEGVLVSGTASAPLVGECSRCLDPLTDRVDVELQELYVYPEAEEVDEDTPRLVGDLLDLEPALRDAVVLALPLAPLCREDCPGLCATCGERLADLPAGHGHEVRDPRWAGLQALLDGPADDDRPTETDPDTEES